MSTIPYDEYMVERSRKALAQLSDLDAFGQENDEYVFIMQTALLATSDIFVITNVRRQELFEIKRQAQKLLLQAQPVSRLHS